MSQSPIFVKTYELLLWLVPRATTFPREQRFVLARHVQDIALRFQEYLIEAGTLSKESQQAKLVYLNKAEVTTTSDFGLFPTFFYEFASNITDWPGGGCVIEA